ncbi:hypothetical protein STEG23_038347 [Scotinomys teguina]
MALRRASCHCNTWWEAEWQVDTGKTGEQSDSFRSSESNNEPFPSVVVCCVRRTGPSQGKAVRVNQHSGDTGAVEVSAECPAVDQATMPEVKELSEALPETPMDPITGVGVVASRNRAPTGYDVVRHNAS